MGAPIYYDCTNCEHDGTRRQSDKLLQHGLGNTPEDLLRASSTGAYIYIYMLLTLDWPQLRPALLFPQT